MNKRLFQYCQKHLRLIDQGRLKANASLEKLSEYNVGHIENGFFHFTVKDKQRLIELVARELNGLRLSDAYPEKTSRTDIAQKNRNEKVSALNVSEDFVLLNSLHSLRINNQVIQNGPLSTLGHFICASEIETIEHQQIVFVENLIVMANLSRLNIPDELKEALWLYRGDIQAFNQTGTAYTFFRRFQDSHCLICFSDIDPSGLQISLTSGATHGLTLSETSSLNIELQGDENEWFKQKNAITYLNQYPALPRYYERLFTLMKETHTTLKQEHILQHCLPLTILPLTR
jgi:hypothetical protein